MSEFNGGNLKLIVDLDRLLFFECSVEFLRALLFAEPDFDFYKGYDVELFFKLQLIFVLQAF